MIGGHEIQRVFSDYHCMYAVSTGFNRLVAYLCECVIVCVEGFDKNGISARLMRDRAEITSKPRAFGN